MRAFIVLATLDSDLPVDENTFHSCAALVRIEAGGILFDYFWVEDNKTCLETSKDLSTVFNSEKACGKSRHLPNGLLQGQNLFLTDIFLQYSGEAPVIAGMDAYLSVGNSRSIA